MKFSVLTAKLCRKFFYENGHWCLSKCPFFIPVIIYNVSQGYRVMLISNTCIPHLGGGGKSLPLWPWTPNPRVVHFIKTQSRLKDFENWAIKLDSQFYKYLHGTNIVTHTYKLACFTIVHNFYGNPEMDFIEKTVSR